MSFMVFDADGLGLLSVVNFDAMLSEVHNDSATVTEHPVESGAKVSDHVAPNQPKLSVEAFVTNTPISSNLIPSFFTSQQIGLQIGVQLPMVLQGAMNRWVNGAQVRGGDIFPLQTNGFKRPQTPIVTTAATRAQIPNVVAGSSLQFPRRVDRAREVYDALQKVMKKRVEVAFYTDIRDYPSVYISSMSVPRVAEDSLTFSMELTAVEFADSKTVTVTKRRPEEKRAAETAVQGPQPTAQDLFGTEEDTGSTVARELLQSIAGG